MSQQNPYQTPAETASSSALNPDDSRSLLGMEFESDWSAEGLRARRKSELQKVGDSIFSILTVLWILSLLFALNGMLGGFACLLTFAWMLFGLVWYSNVVWRGGGSFPQKVPALAGPVQGRFDGGWVRIEGPALRIATRTQNCPRWQLSSGGAAIQPPGIDTLLPIGPADIRRQWKSQDREARSPSPADLVGQLSSDENFVTVSGTVRGGDFRGQSCWWFWLLLGITLTSVALIGVVFSVYTWLQLPPWVTDPPNHYQRNDADVRALFTPVFAFVLSSVFLAVGLWSLTRTFRVVGRFAARITPTMVAIADQRMAYGYHTAALPHFRWTQHGMVVRDAAKYVQFILPARWFDQHQRKLVAEWYSGDVSPAANLYIGPRI